MEYVTIWVKVGYFWSVERTHSKEYAKVLLGNDLEKEINEKFYKAFPENVNPNNSPNTGI